MGEHARSVALRDMVDFARQRTGAFQAERGVSHLNVQPTALLQASHLEVFAFTSSPASPSASAGTR